MFSTVLWDKVSVLGEDTLCLKLRDPGNIWMRWGRRETSVVQTEWSVFKGAEEARTPRAGATDMGEPGFQRINHSP